MTTYYKFLNEDQSSCHGGSGKWRKNQWKTVTEELVACKNGLHLCRQEDLVYWLGPAVWEVEAVIDDETLYCEDKVVVRKAKIVKKLNWNKAECAAVGAADTTAGVAERKWQNERIIELFYD